MVRQVPEETQQNSAVGRHEEQSTHEEYEEREQSKVCYPQQYSVPRRQQLSTRRGDIDRSKVESKEATEEEEEKEEEKESQETTQSGQMHSNERAEAEEGAERADEGRKQETYIQPRTNTLVKFVLYETKSVCHQ